MSRKIQNRKNDNRDASCDFNDIDEIEDGDSFTPINQSTSKMDVDSLLKKSKEARDKIRKNMNNANKINDNKPTTIDSINLENKRKPHKSFTSSHQGDTESENESKRSKHAIIEECVIDLTSQSKNQKIEKFEKKNKPKTILHNSNNNENKIDEVSNQNSDPYLLHSNTEEMMSKQPKTTRNITYLKEYDQKAKNKHVSISMNDTPSRALHEDNYRRIDMEGSPKISSETRFSQNMSRLNPAANRSSTSSNACKFKIGSLSKNNRLTMSTPRKAEVKHRENEGIFKFVDKQHLLSKMPEALLQQLENEKMKVDILQHEINFRAQREAKIVKEMEELHKAVKMREDINASERAKEKEIIQRNLKDKDQKIEHQAEKIRELSNIVQENTSKVKTYESKIHMLEMTIKELEASNK